MVSKWPSMATKFTRVKAHGLGKISPALEGVGPWLWK
jgi:hypothetical protein